MAAAVLQSPAERRKQLQRVLASGTLRNSEALRNLLAYLGEKSLAEPPVELKEYTIGIEACGKPPSYDPQKDASVRVQVGRLRQKLEEYHRTEGASDALVLELPKGRFTLLVHPRQRRPLRIAALAARLRSADPVRLALAITLAAAIGWGGWLTRSLRELEGRAAAEAELVRTFSPLWGPFFNRAIPTAVVFGSPPFFAGDTHQLFIRLYGATDPDDPRSCPQFDEVNRRVGPLVGPRFDYASMGDAIAVQHLTAFFGSAGMAIRAVPAHRATWESIKDGNLIFIGASRMHPLLRRLPIEQDFELSDGEIVRNRRPQDGEEEVYSTPSHRDVMTYAAVGFFPGLHPGREVVIINTHSSPGAIAAVEFITTPGNMKLLQERIGLQAGASRRHFQMLLRVFVDNDVPMKAEYITHHLSTPRTSR